MTVSAVAIDVLSRIDPLLSGVAADQRQLEVASAEERLSAVLDEIADIILPRKLELEISGARCSLIVSNARVLSADEGGVPAADNESRDARLARIAGRLLDFCQAKGPLRATQLRLPEPVADDVVGCHHVDLRQFLDQHCDRHNDAEPDQTDVPFEDTLQQASIVSARFAPDGSVSDTEGDADYLPDGIELAGLYSDFGLLCDQGGPRGLTYPVLVMLQDTKNKAACVIAVYATETGTSVHVIEAGNASGLARAWAAERAREQSE